MLVILSSSSTGDLFIEKWVMSGPGKHFYVHRETGTIQRMPADLFHPKVEGVGHICRFIVGIIDHSEVQIRC